MDFQGSERNKVLLSGASGMLGKALSKALHQQGVGVARLTRDHSGSGPDVGVAELSWDPASGEVDVGKLDALGQLRAAVHLSGANVSSRRWNAAYKREMRESRVTTTQVLANGLARMKNPPAVLLVASAVGLYGDRGDQILDEKSEPGEGYFPELCEAWEAAAEPAVQAGIRVVHMRFGVVIGPDGGALAKLVPLFKLGMGGRLGSGRQWMSWVGERDVVAAAIYAMENSKISGPLNVTSPNPVTNAEFTRELASAVHRPALLPAPAFALRLAFGEMADEALLSSTRAVPKRLIEGGFSFLHPFLGSALAEAVAHS